MKYGPPNAYLYIQPLHRNRENIGGRRPRRVELHLLRTPIILSPFSLLATLRLAVFQVMGFQEIEKLDFEQYFAEEYWWRPLYHSIFVRGVNPLPRTERTCGDAG